MMHLQTFSFVTLRCADDDAGVDSEEHLAVAAVAIECRIDECNILTIKFSSTNLQLDQLM